MYELKLKFPELKITEGKMCHKKYFKKINENKITNLILVLPTAKTKVKNIVI